MRVIQLQAENFKRLSAVDITPEGNMVVIGGKNGSGKSSVLDAIYVALLGRAANPPKPIRAGEESCTIRLDLGELIVTRRFINKEGGSYTDTLKIERPNGDRVAIKPQDVLDALLGEIGFDPFAFVQMKPAEQAETLLRMVPLPIDLDEFAESDASDYARRRDINRDLAAAEAQLKAIPEEQVPDNLPDRQALVDQLGNAANANADIERERIARESRARQLSGLDSQIAELESKLVNLRQQKDEVAAAIKAEKPLPEPVDSDSIRQQLHEADALLARVDRQTRRAALARQVTDLAAQSQALTDAMGEREKQRQDALAKAKMPIEGLGFAVDEKGRAVVTFGGVPFEQASTAEQLRASTAIAMAANPTLRVARIKDGSLLDDDSLGMLAEMAGAEDFQLWVERVGTGGVGIVMENGEVAAAKPKGKAKEKPEGAML